MEFDENVTEEVTKEVADEVTKEVTVEEKIEETNVLSEPSYASTYENTVSEKPVKKGNGKVKHFFGRVAVLAASGLLFGLCAAVAFGLVNYYTNKSYQGTVESSEELQKKIEEDIMTKIDDRKPAAVFEDVDGESKENYTFVTDVSQVAEKVMPSVVSITNQYVYTQNFWGRQYSEQAEASGSGIIIGENEDELLVATNNHVIDQAETLKVQFIDGTDAEANVKGADADMDIAVIAVRKDDLQEATKNAIVIASLGDSDKLKVGEPAIAIGNALGYGQSVTTGVISAVNRELEISEGEFSQGFIQTDAAINPGNSGGALLNVYGQVIGINSNKIGGSSVEGMGYAIPISNALPIIDNLKTKKTKKEVAEGERGYLGISGRGVSSEMAEIYDFPQGVYVYDVYPGTGAADANLRKGDIITKFEGSTINSMEKLQDYLAYYEAGETVDLTIERLDESGVYQECQVTIKLVERSLLPTE